VCTSADVYYVGSDDENYTDEAERRRRYEKAGQKFLEGQVPFLLSASLQGPFDKESGWTNPWIATRPSKSGRTTSTKKKIQSFEQTSKISSTYLRGKRKPTPDSLECHLPSPESLKQVSVSEGHPFLEDDELEMVQAWRHSVELVQNSRTDLDLPSQRPTADKSKKRKSTGNGWLKTDSAKRPKAQQIPQTTSKSLPMAVAQTSNNNQIRFASKPDLKPPQLQPSPTGDIKTTHREPMSQLISPPKNTPSKKKEVLNCPINDQLDGADSASEEDGVAALSSPVSMHKQNISAPDAQKPSTKEQGCSNAGSPEHTSSTRSESQRTQAVPDSASVEEVQADKVTQDAVQHDESFAYKVPCQSLPIETHSPKHIPSDRGASDSVSNDARSSTSAPARQDTLEVCGDNEMKLDDLNQQTVPNSFATAEDATIIDHGVGLDRPVEDTKHHHITSVSTDSNVADSVPAASVTEKQRAEMEMRSSVTGDSNKTVLFCEYRPEIESNCDNQAAIAEDAEISAGLAGETPEQNKPDPVVTSENVAKVSNEPTAHVETITWSTEDHASGPLCPSTAVEVDTPHKAADSALIDNTEVTMGGVEEPTQPNDKSSVCETRNDDAIAHMASSEPCQNREAMIPSIEEDVVKEEPLELAALQNRIPINPGVQPSEPVSVQAENTEQDELDNCDEHDNAGPGDLPVDNSSPDPSSQLVAESQKRNIPDEEPEKDDSASDVTSEIAENENEVGMDCSPSIEETDAEPTMENTEVREAASTPTTAEQRLSIPAAEHAVSISQQSPWHKEAYERDDSQGLVSGNEDAKNVFTTADATPTAISPCDQNPWVTEPITPLHAKETPVHIDNTPCPMSKETTQSDKPEQAPEAQEPSSTAGPGTPEPQFAFKSFASFMTPSPERSRVTRQRFGSRKSLRHPHVKGILASKDYTACKTRQPKRVTWALCPNETETLSSADDPTSHETQHDRPASPPPAAPLAELPTSSNDKFSGHFSAVVKRTDGLRHSFRIPKDNGQDALSWQESNQATVQANGTVDVEMRDAPAANDCDERGRIDREPSQSQEPMDMVEDMLCEMGDFWQPWNVDAELEQAKKTSSVNVPELGIGSQNPW
jgi:hypothetical protein